FGGGLPYLADRKLAVMRFESAIANRKLAHFVIAHVDANRPQAKPGGVLRFERCECDQLLGCFPGTSGFEVWVDRGGNAGGCEIEGCLPREPGSARPAQTDV